MPQLVWGTNKVSWEDRQYGQIPRSPAGSSSAVSSSFVISRHRFHQTSNRAEQMLAQVNADSLRYSSQTALRHSSLSTTHSKQNLQSLWFEYIHLLSHSFISFRTIFFIWKSLARPNFSLLKPFLSPLGHSDFFHFPLNTFFYSFQIVILFFSPALLVVFTNFSILMFFFFSQNGW